MGSSAQPVVQKYGVIGPTAALQPLAPHVWGNVRRDPHQIPHQTEFECILTRMEIGVGGRARIDDKTGKRIANAWESEVMGPLNRSMLEMLDR